MWWSWQWGDFFLDSFVIGAKRCLAFCFTGEACRECPPCLDRSCRDKTFYPAGKGPQKALLSAGDHRDQMLANLSQMTKFPYPCWMCSIPWVYAKLPHHVSIPHISITLWAVVSHALCFLLTAVTKAWMASADIFLHLPSPGIIVAGANREVVKARGSKVPLQGPASKRWEIAIYRQLQPWLPLGAPGAPAYSLCTDVHTVC